MAHPHDVFRVGRATVTKVEDILLDNFKPSQLIPDWDATLIEHHPDWLPAGTLDGASEHVLLSVHTWVVREDGRIVLVDTGVGNSKSRPYAAYFDHLRTPYLERLKAIGIEPEAVDYVLMTHLHLDHVGWNTRLDQGRWIPTFPNARHIFSRAEHAYFQDPANHNERNRTSFMVQKDSVDPVVDAGLADMIAVSGAEPIPGFTFHSTPGHSIDHSSIELRSGGETALFAGDVLHHPVQDFHPEWLSILDAFPEDTLRSRHWALDFAAERDAVFFSSHFADSSAGKVSRHGKAYAWRFL